MRRRLDKCDGSLDQIVRALADPIIRRPLFCDLLGQTSMSLEHNATLDAAREFKVEIVRIVGDLTEALVGAADSKLSGEEALDLVGATTLMAGALWPIANPPPIIAALYASEPAIAAVACIEFAPTLRRVLAQLVHGLPSAR